MKKFVALAICAASVAGAMAQKQVVDQAAKMAGKFDKLPEARALIKEAMQNPETAEDVRTYFVAGDLEYSAYDKGILAGQINPSDPQADRMTMARELLDGYNMMMKALPLDAQPDAKGKSGKFGKKIASTVAGHLNDYFNAGGEFYNNKQYPEAYELFTIYADMPDQDWLGKVTPQLAPEQRAQAYYYAGLAAYFSKEPLKATASLKNARLNGYEDPEAQNYVMEIACWQQLANDSTMTQQAKSNIIDVARAGFQKYGLQVPLFFSNLINSLISDGQFGQAYSLMDQEIANNPENGWLYGLRGYVCDVDGKDEASVKYYRKAAELPGSDFETLKNAARKIFRQGQEEWNKIEGNSADAQKARADIRQNYFEVAKAITDKASQMPNADSSIDYIVDAINYMLGIE